MDYILLLGRIFYVAIFIASGFNHFSQKTVDYAIREGVPMASFLVKISAIPMFLGGGSILLGYHAQIGAWLIVAYLVPVTLRMHRFWLEKNPEVRFIQLGMFMKNLSMLGAALIIAYFGSGPLSLTESDWASIPSAQAIKKP
jgi:putative oxidoreductase